MSEGLHRYQYRVSWSENEMLFVAKAAEWPDLAATAPRKPDALHAIHQLVAQRLAGQL